MVDEIKSTQQIQLNKQIDRNKPSLPDNVSTDGLTNKTAASAHSEKSQVSLTNTAEQLYLLQEQIAKQPVIDSQRVESIKKTIADGSFLVNTNETAEKIMGLEKLLQSAFNKE